MAKKKKQITVDALKEYVRTEGAEFLKRPNVTSVGIGYKQTGGKKSKTLSVQFTVGEKIAAESLEQSGLESLPKTVSVGGVEVPTDVLERSYTTEYRPVKITAKLEAASPRKVAVDPVQPGVSIGHFKISAGTLGCVVYDAHSGAPYVLSNWHVLHGGAGQIGDSIVQPGKHDDNRIERNKVGKLVRSHLGAAGDCAIATIDSRRLDETLLDLNVKVNAIAEPELDDRVTKSGRTTDVTFGIVTRVHVTSRIDYDGVGEREIGGFEIGPDPEHPAANGEISMGGDSGSAWVAVERNKATSTMLGLHFAGETGNAPEHALACYPASVFEKLEILPAPPTVLRPEAAASGYAPAFLGATIAVPQPATTAVRNDLLKVDDEPVLDYMHFSVAMSKSRKFARWVAWNIDGSSLRRLSRTNIRFKKDPRLPAAAQIGDELYANNDLDRGHLARRADLLWGSAAAAERANVDSFFFTNITPQHAEFNQSSAGGIWGELENAIFADVEVEELKISVLGGPIFRTADPEYRGVKLPKQFWKIIYYREVGDATVVAKGFVLTQADLISGLEALELPEFAVFEVPIPRIGELTGLKFAGAEGPETTRGKRAPARRTRQSAETVGIRRITSVREIVG